MTRSTQMMTRQKGIALITTLLMMTATLLLGSVMVASLDWGIRESGRFRKNDQAFYIAEAGLNKAMAWFNTVYGQPNAGTAGFGMAAAPVTWTSTSGGVPERVSLPTNHPNGTYTDCPSGAIRTGISDSFTSLLVNQSLGGGSFTVQAFLTTAQNDCSSAPLPPTRTDEMWEVRSTGIYQGKSVTAVAIFRRRYNALWDYAAFGKSKVRFDSNSRSESFNSSTGTFTPTPPPGSWSNTCACDASTGTNGTTSSGPGGAPIEVGSNAVINGNATPGPGAGPDAVRIDSNGVVTGSTAPASEAKILPTPTAAPSCVAPSCSDYRLDGNNTATISPGNYNEIRVDSNAILTLNPGTYYVTRFDLNSNSEVLLNGSVTLIVRDRFEIDSNSRANFGGSPLNFEVIVTDVNEDGVDPSSTNADVDIDSNGGFFGTIYAPNAKVNVDSNARLYGAVVGDRVRVDSNAKIFYDKNLQNFGVRTAGDVALAFFFGKP